MIGKLKPCPFCGRQPSHTVRELSDEGWSAHIWCAGHPPGGIAHASAWSRDVVATADDAIASAAGAWNTRQMSFNLKFHTDSLIEDCLLCAKRYEEAPGLVQPATIIDLYQAIARLTRIIQAAHALPLR
jgi:hypothetical protein